MAVMTAWDPVQMTWRVLVVAVAQGLTTASWVGSVQSVGVTSPAKHCHNSQPTPGT